MTSRTALMTPILLAPASVEDDGELGLLGRRSRRAAAAARRSRRHRDRSRLDAPLVLELLGQRREVACTDILERKSTTCSFVTSAISIAPSGSFIARSLN